MRTSTILLFLIFLTQNSIFAQNFEGGDGSSGTPWQIATAAQLDELRNYTGDVHADKHFILTANIDLTSYLTPGGAGFDKWGANGWQPIGEWSNFFTGNFDGDGYAIIGLMINITANNAGFFGNTGETSIIKNIYLIEVDIAGGNSTGMIAGYNQGTIENVHVSGTLGGNQDVGGLTGVNTGTIINCSSEGALTATYQNSGGLIGNNVNASVSNSHSNVIVNGQHSPGGLIGYNWNSDVENCYATGDVSGNGCIGGLVGIFNGGSITNSAAFGDLTGTGMDLGGLIGYIYAGAATNNYAHGNAETVTSLSGQKVGGLVGSNQSTVSLSYAIGSTEAGASKGGILGTNSSVATCQDSYWDKSTSLLTNAIGYIDGTITNLVGLNTTDMKGVVAQSNMNALDFITIWQTVNGASTDATADGYPILQSIDRAAQLRAQGILATFNLTTLASPVEGGSISGDGQFGVGEQTTIFAIPAEGYVFVEWSGPITNIDDPTKATAQVTMPASDVALTAIFVQIDYPITISKIPAAGGTATGSGTANLGDVVAIAATPETGYQFVEWTGDTQYLDDPTAASASLTMPAAGVNLTANFELVDYSIAISANTAAGGTTTGSGTANFGDVVAITASPETGYQFVEWTGDTQHLDDPTAASASLTMPAAGINLTANFELVDYAISISANPVAGGTTTGSGTANYGDVVTISASPETGYQFTGWIGDTQHLNDPTAASASLTMPAAGVNLTANFELVDYSIAISANTAAGGTTTGSGTANFGDVVAITATPETGYQFVEWTGDTQHLDDLTAPSASLTMPAAGVSLTANFELVDYAISISANPVAGGTTTGSGTANFGDVVAITASPGTGYQFVEWTGDTQYLDDPTAASASLSMPAADVNLTANFELVDYSIAISANPAAGGTTTGSGTANFGDVVAITATPETGYQFVEWTGDTQHLDDLTAPSASLTMPAADVNLTANFELVDYSIAISANTAAGGTTTGSGTANFGDVVAIAATPETGYQFVEWTGDTQNLDDPTAPSASLTVPAADVNLTANFELVDYAVTISANPVAGGTTTGSGTANFGDVVAVSASPGNEYQFTGWTGDTQYLDDLNSASTNLTMPAGDVSLTANFELKEHQLTTVASPAEGGEVSGGGIYHHQEEFTLTAEPAVGYVFTAWTIGSSLIAETPVFTQQMPPLSFIITAHFVKINYQLTLSKNINEGGTVSGGGTFNFEDEATVTAIPATGYIFVNWTDASDNVVSDQESFNYPMPSSDATLTANFDLVTSLTQTKDEAPMVWPNPFDTHINIGSIDNIKRIVIISQSGQIVYEKDNPDNTIITSGLKPGIYLIKIIDETGKITMSKLIKQ